MLNKEINETNYMHDTRAMFLHCARPTREPDYVSESGSEYWHCGNKVIRCSDHWSDCECTYIASCYWLLDGCGRDSDELYMPRCGYAYFSDFKPLRYQCESYGIVFEVTVDPALESEHWYARVTDEEIARVSWMIDLDACEEVTFCLESGKGVFCAPQSFKNKVKENVCGLFEVL